MFQAFRNSRRRTPYTALSCFSALLLLAATSFDVWADPFLRVRTDTLNHEQNPEISAFFTLNSDGTLPFIADGGWAPKNPAKAGEITSTTPTKTYNLVGTSTAPDWAGSGNGVPTGITLSFNVEFTISALPAGSYLTNPGPSGSTLGRGIGITQVLGGNDDIDKPDGIAVSAATISNVSWTGTLTDPNFLFTPGGVSNFGTRVFRSNNFDETVAGMLLTQGADTIGFGQVTGTLASNLVANNNFGTGTTPSSIFDRRVGPYTLVVAGPDATNNVAVIKGIGVAYDVTYDISAAPVPVPGDYNHNGTVDAADYVLWREGDPAADSNGDTVVDQIDYDFWRANFGNPGPGAGTNSGGAVPEPVSAAFIAIGLAACCCSRRCAMRRK